MVNMFTYLQLSNLLNVKTKGKLYTDLKKKK